jgi:hypothetical protein
LIKKYGEKFGLAVFEKKVHKGMSLAMVEDAIGKLIPLCTFFSNTAKPNFSPYFLINSFFFL